MYRTLKTLALVMVLITASLVFTGCFGSSDDSSGSSFTLAGVAANSKLISGNVKVYNKSGAIGSGTVTTDGTGAYTALVSAASTAGPFLVTITGNTTATREVVLCDVIDLGTTTATAEVKNHHVTLGNTTAALKAMGLATADFAGLTTVAQVEAAIAGKATALTATIATTAAANQDVFNLGAGITTATTIDNIVTATRTYLGLGANDYFGTTAYATVEAYTTKASIAGYSGSAAALVKDGTGVNSTNLQSSGTAGVLQLASNLTVTNSASFNLSLTLTTFNMTSFEAQTPISILIEGTTRKVSATLSGLKHAAGALSVTGTEKTAVNLYNGTSWGTATDVNNSDIWTVTGTSEALIVANIAEILETVGETLTTGVTYSFTITFDNWILKSGLNYFTAIKGGFTYSPATQGSPLQDADTYYTSAKSNYSTYQAYAVGDYTNASAYYSALKTGYDGLIGADATAATLKYHKKILENESLTGTTTYTNIVILLSACQSAYADAISGYNGEQQSAPQRAGYRMFAYKAPDAESKALLKEALKNASLGKELAAGTLTNLSGTAVSDDVKNGYKLAANFAGAKVASKLAVGEPTYSDVAAVFADTANDIIKAAPTAQQQAIEFMPTGGDFSPNNLKPVHMIQTKAMAKLNAGEFESAKDIFDTAKKVKENPGAYGYLGTSLEVVAVGDDHNFNYGLGKTYYEMGKPDLAKPYLAKVTENIQEVKTQMLEMANLAIDMAIKSCMEAKDGFNGLMIGTQTINSLSDISAATDETSAIFAIIKGTVVQAVAQTMAQLYQPVSAEANPARYYLKLAMEKIFDAETYTGFVGRDVALEAISDLKKVLDSTTAINQEKAQALLKIAEIYKDHLTDTTNAQVYLQRIIKNYPGVPQYQKASDMIQLLNGNKTDDFATAWQANKPVVIGVTAAFAGTGSFVDYALAGDIIDFDCIADHPQGAAKITGTAIKIFDSTNTLQQTVAMTRDAADPKHFFMHGFQIPADAYPGEYRLDFVVTDDALATGMRSLSIKVASQAMTFDSTQGTYTMTGLYIREAFYDAQNKAVKVYISEPKDSKLFFEFWKAGATDPTAATLVWSGEKTLDTTIKDLFNFTDLSKLTAGSDYMAKLTLKTKLADSLVYTQHSDYFEIMFRMVDSEAAKTAAVNRVKAFITALNALDDANPNVENLMTHFIPDNTAKQYAREVWTRRLNNLRKVTVSYDAADVGEFHIWDALVNVYNFHVTGEVVADQNGFIDPEIMMNTNMTATPKTYNLIEPSMKFFVVYYDDGTTKGWYLIEQAQNEMAFMNDTFAADPTIFNNIYTDMAGFHKFGDWTGNLSAQAGDRGVGDQSMFQMFSFNAQNKTQTECDTAALNFVNAWITPFRPDFVTFMKDRVLTVMKAPVKEYMLMNSMPVNFRNNGVDYDMEFVFQYRFTQMVNGLPQEIFEIRHLTWGKLLVGETMQWRITDAWTEQNMAGMYEMDQVYAAVNSALGSMNTLKQQWAGIADGNKQTELAKVMEAIWLKSNDLDPQIQSNAEKFASALFNPALIPTGALADSSVSFSDKYPIYGEMVGPSMARVELNDGTVLILSRGVNKAGTAGWYLYHVQMSYLTADRWNAIKAAVQPVLDNFVAAVKAKSDTSAFVDAYADWFMMDAINQINNGSLVMPDTWAPQLYEGQIRSAYSLGDGNKEVILDCRTMNGTSLVVKLIVSEADNSISAITFLYYDFYMAAGNFTSTVGYGMTDADQAAIKALLIQFNSLMQDLTATSPTVDTVMNLFDSSRPSFTEMYNYFNGFWYSRAVNNPIYQDGMELNVWPNMDGEYGFFVPYYDQAQNFIGGMDGQIVKKDGVYRFIYLMLPPQYDPSSADNNPVLKPVKAFKDGIMEYAQSFISGDAVGKANALLKARGAFQETAPTTVFDGMDLTVNGNIPAILDMWLPELAVDDENNNGIFDVNDDYLKDIEYWEVIPVNQYYGQAMAGAEFVVMLNLRWEINFYNRNYENYEFFLKNYGDLTTPDYRVMGIRAYIDAGDLELW
ncbi:MAG: tetratricopeptide repeat protein, partial [Candidatus Wallbacteria bacterium]|nr:tetratricopeptide repeat protein [Candidatus Wallbacteria bacterium]